MSEKHQAFQSSWVRVLGTSTKLRVRIPRPKPRLASDFRTDLVEANTFSTWDTFQMDAFKAIIDSECV